jgi:ABC-type transport system, involved in lipoprotein release, permease component
MWIKNFRQRKLQTVLIFFIIVICTTLLAGAMSILTSLEKPCRDFAESCNAASAKVYSYTEDIQTFADQFLSLPGVKNVEYVNFFEIPNLYLKNEKVDLFADLTEYNEKVFGSDIYLEGNSTAAKKLTDNECILPACISNEYDIHTGDSITVDLSGKKLLYNVVAIYTDPYENSTAFDCDILVKKLPEWNIRNTLYIYGENQVKGKQIEKEFLEKYDGILNGTVLTLEERTDNSQLVGNIIGAIFLSVGIIMLLVSALMIHYMISNTMISDARKIAVYKTMGYTSGDILFLYLKFYFVIVTLACFTGIGCSLFVSDAVLTSTFQNMGRLQAENPLLPGIISYLVIVSFVIGVITVNILQSRRIKPVHALNGFSYGGIRKKKKYKGNSSLQFSPMGIAYRSFVREKKNALSIIITCIVTIFCVNFIMISLDIAGTMKENNDYWIGIDRSDVDINFTDASSYPTISSIVEKDGRTNYYFSSLINKAVTMKWKKGMSRTTMNAFVYDDFNRAGLVVIEGRNPETADEIAISTTMSTELHKNIGDYLEVYLNADKKANFLITGLFQTYIHFGGACRLTSSAYTEHGIDMKYNMISVYLKNKEEINDYIKDMNKQIGGTANIVKRTEQYSTIMDMITQPQQKAIPPVAALIIVMAGVNIFSIVYLKNMRSQKINGIYKCIGYSTGHLISSNLIYVTAIALLSTAITIPISYFTYTPIMKLSLSILNFREYLMRFNLVNILLVDTAVVIMFAISTLASSKELFRVNARDLVQE